MMTSVQLPDFEGCAQEEMEHGFRLLNQRMPFLAGLSLQPIWSIYVCKIQTEAGCTNQGNFDGKIIHYNHQKGVDNDRYGIIIHCQPPFGDYNGLSFHQNFPDWHLCHIIHWLSSTHQLLLG